MFLEVTLPTIVSIHCLEYWELEAGLMDHPRCGPTVMLCSSCYKRISASALGAFRSL